MSGNGTDREHAIVNRFFKLLGAASPKVRPAMPEPAPEPDESELLRRALARWAKDAPAEFWTALDRWVGEAHANVKANFRDHPTSAYAVGFEDCIEQIRDRFRSWRGQLSPDGENPQRSENAG